jgi:hypothetical protein
MAKIAISQQKSSPHPVREVSDVWSFGKDGKRYDYHPKHLRK